MSETCETGVQENAASQVQVTPVQLAHAENLLSRTVRKDDFLAMNVLGQFNLGFIITNLDVNQRNSENSATLPSTSDLYIVDQHAADEKYKFETFWAETAIHEQKLIIPKPLDLSLEHEVIVREHIDIFHANGFDFQFEKAHEDDVEDDGNRSSGQSRILITRLPQSKNVSFSSHDIAQLCELIRESPYTCSRKPTQVENESASKKKMMKIPRIPRLDAIYASRACRAAVMIGTALHKQKLKQIITQLSTLDQPWSCPHGRPTMRHLIDLRQYSKYCQNYALQLLVKTQGKYDQLQKKFQEVLSIYQQAEAANDTTQLSKLHMVLETLSQQMDEISIELNENEFQYKQALSSTKLISKNTPMESQSQIVSPLVQSIEQIHAILNSSFQQNSQ